MKRAALLLLVLLGALLIPASPASAHAALLRTVPAASTVVEQAPRQILLQFSEPVEPVPGQIRIIGPDGKRADRGEPTVDAGQLSIGLRDDPARGTYLVTYRILSDDSHPISGGFSFSIGAVSASPPAPSGGATAEVDRAVAVLLPVARYVGYAGLALLIGPTLLVMGLWPRRLARPAKLIWPGTAMVAAATAAGLYLQAPYVTGSALFAVTGRDLSEVLDSRFGVAGLVRLVALVAAIPLLRQILAGKNNRTIRGALTGLAVLAALTWPLAGHPSASLAPALSIAADVVHLLSMAVWFGGLIGLALYLLPKGNDRELDALMPVWAGWAGWAVAALVLTGLAGALMEVGTLPALFGTRYGQLLLVKAGILAVVLSSAALARRFVLTGKARPVRRLVFVEMAGLAVVLAVTTLLVQTTPARTAIALPDTAVPNSVTLTSELYRLQVEIEPAKVGVNTMHVYAFTPDGGAALTVLEWQVTMALPAQGIGPVDTPVLRLTPDHATGELTFPSVGTWELRFTVRTSDTDQATVTHTLQLK